MANIGKITVTIDKASRKALRDFIKDCQKAICQVERLKRITKPTTVNKKHASYVLTDKQVQLLQKRFFNHQTTI